MAKTEQTQRIAIGFAGGQVLNARVTESAHGDLVKALEGGDELFTLKGEDGTALVRTSQVVYVRVDADEQRVGFGL
jgi:hypothetical protein